MCLISNNSLSTSTTTNIIILLLIQLFPFCINSQINSCSKGQIFTEQQLWLILKPTETNRYFYLSIGCLSILLLLICISSWCFFKSFVPPSDIMLMIAISKIIENGCNVALVVYYEIYSFQSNVPSNFDMFCKFHGFFYVIGHTACLSLNLIFCFLLSFTLQNTLKRSLFSQRIYNSLSAIIIIIICFILIFTHNSNNSLQGLCGYRKINNQSVIRFIIQGLISCFSIYFMVNFRKKIPKNRYFQEQAVFGCYYYYMGFFTGLQIITASIFIIIYTICRIKLSHFQNIVTIIITIQAFLNTLQAFSIFALRINHPVLQDKIKSIFYKQQTEQDLLDSQRSNTDLNNNNEQESSWLGSLLISLRGSQILSFLQGVTIGLMQNKKQITAHTLITPLHFQRHYHFELNQEISEKNINKRVCNRVSLLIQQQLHGLTALDYHVTMFCPQVFIQILRKQYSLNLLQSLNIRMNIKIVKQNSVSNGGKSGQFFFSTYDHRFLVKTISAGQAEIYLSRLQRFYEYYKTYNDSLIVKILGMYQFCRKDIDEDPIYIIIMKNLTQAPFEDNLRLYDIKGSKFNRFTMAQQNIFQGDQKLKKFTLKDRDFQTLQKKVQIKPNDQQKLKFILKRDIQFLSKMQVIDYSLLIIKKKKKKFNEKTIHGLTQVQSTQNQEYVYNFGIIDYLQTWNLKRKAERMFKTLITSDEVTVSSPKIYGSRLAQLIDKII